MITKNWCVAGVALALLGACAPQVETQAVTSELAPAEARVSQAGDTWVRLNVISGTEETGKFVAVSDGVYSWENSDGCKSTGPVGTFAVFYSWENCNGSTGTQSYDSVGSLYPLEVGKSVTRKVNGKNDRGNTWETNITCTVEGTANVTVPAGTFDTYHVRCDDKWNVRDYYYAPDVGVSAISRRSRKDRNEVRHYELISFTPGSGSV